jgi:hypothetical protein
MAENRIELTDRQRDRIESIKDECKEANVGCPRPTDEQIMKSLLDTWDAVGDGLYSDDP